MKTIVVNEEVFLKNPNLYLNALQEFCPDITKEQMLQTIQSRSFYCFVFDDKNSVVSWCRVAKPWNRKTIYCIRQVETRENARGKGYASLCFSQIEDHIHSNDTSAKKIITFVDCNNTSSIRLHEKLGYSQNHNPSSYLKNLYGWNNAIMFEKNIVKQELLEQ